MDLEKSSKTSAANNRLDDACSAFEQGRLDEAFRLYLTCAQDGDPIAQTKIGWMYERGRGISQDLAEAEKWYRLAAAARSEEGCFYLADLLDTAGRIEEAKTFYEMAANLGSLTAAYRLGANCARFKTNNAYWLKLAVDSRHMFAMLLLGRRIIRGQMSGGIGKGIKLVIAAIWHGCNIVRNMEDPNRWREHPQIRR